MVDLDLTGSAGRVACSVDVMGGLARRQGASFSKFALAALFPHDQAPAVYFSALTPHVPAHFCGHCTSGNCKAVEHENVTLNWPFHPVS